MLYTYIYNTVENDVVKLAIRQDRTGSKKKQKQQKQKNGESGRRRECVCVSKSADARNTIETRLQGSIAVHAFHLPPPPGLRSGAFHDLRRDIRVDALFTAWAAYAASRTLLILCVPDAARSEAPPLV